MILEQLLVGSMGVCCYLIGCEETKKGAIVDPGGDERRILAEVEKLGLQIEYIIATHGHPDHVCGNRIIMEATGGIIVMHEADADYFEKPETQNYFSMLGLEPSPPAQKRVKDGDLIEVGNVKLRVIHTPGHTPGGICLYSAPNLFTGDTLFVGGVGRTDFPGGSYDGLMESLKNKVLTLPEETIIWPGHGYGGSQSTIGEEKRSNPFLR
ncbi:MBL fold metallo-hydrolase [Desulfopila inferna]|uniref:MBL fold metallo-hydrolase n=1 Tax=Desulfopila inferna TaxID=468528 RepID=UPI0019623404|nr:MBL fold metallo-hydrolase [Desulfopila inferna]MBM9603210.1 MBL fold metallo-hydrolase [Desulfopila inferna]